MSDSIHEVLTELHREVGAAGVLFVDGTGETVDLVEGELSEVEMKLLGAYVGIYVRQLRRFLNDPMHGDVELVQIENRGLYLYALPLVDGYSLVLSQRTPALSGVGRRRLVEAGQKLVSAVFDAPGGA